MLYAKGSFTGSYESSSAENIKKARYVIGNEYGAPADKTIGVANEAIAAYIITHFPDLPVCASTSVAQALMKRNPKVKLIGTFTGTSANTSASNGGTWKELELAKGFAGRDWKYPVIVAQAYHVGRVVKQARRAGMHPAVPGDLPRIFDVSSTQWWCHNALFWALREIPGAIILRYRGEL
jgi:hypothetical protein